MGEAASRRASAARGDGVYPPPPRMPRPAGLSGDSIAEVSRNGLFPFRSWREGHPFKVRLAARLRAETTVTDGRIAERLAMGTLGHLAHLLHLIARMPADFPPPHQPGLNT